MRDTSSWRERLSNALWKVWPSETDLNKTTFCDVELGLYLLSQLAPEAPAKSLWVLLTGYQFPVTEAQNWSEEQRHMLGNARHILTQFRSEYSWEKAIRRYRQINELEVLRGYDIDEKLEHFSAREVSICSEREEIYADTLSKPLKHRRKTIKWAEAGSYECPDGKYRRTVRIPEELVLPLPKGHNLEGKTQREAIAVSWEDLMETARWMDSLSGDRWEQRLSRVRLELFDPDNDSLAPAETLTLDGLMHLIGMVSSGKSTLMDILAVWAAKQKLHVTIVVGDVVGALNRAKLFARLGISVAPILGASNRERHTNRLHRTLTAEEPLAQLEQEHIGFQWLSTACPLSELRSDVSVPFKMGKQPCLNLTAIADSDEENSDGANKSKTPKTYACPIYSACPFHQAQRDLVDASIWIATPASLVYPRVAPQINSEYIRFAELVYRHSNLVIVDETDQVQVQLDSLFCPSQKLFGSGGDSWLGQIQQQVVQQLNQQGRGQLADTDVNSWCQAHGMLQMAMNRIYALIFKQEPALDPWIKQEQYFTDWLILSKLAIKLSGAPKDSRDNHSGYRKLMGLFESYIDDPLGNRSKSRLSELTQQAILKDTNDNLLGEDLKQWIVENKQADVSLTEEQLKEVILQLAFALLVAVLQSLINQLLRDWKYVESPLRLEGQSSMLFHSPPRDYEAIIPAAPMGNVLGFQYLKSSDSKGGDLRFFKCMGVGRWLLLHLHELFAAEGIVGPHVLLLSGTSWAGTSPGYHVQVPVAGVLRSPEEELKAIEDSTFEFNPFYDKEGRPISVSGAGQRRVAALKEILDKLAKPGGLGGDSRLERERDELPESRQRILLLVGSYDQAKVAQEHLENLRPDWRGQTVRLVPDDDEFESQWLGNESSLQRGIVHKFASTGAWILIAPLMAIERGHNILNEENKAAIGAAYFLVRPHPRPDDISYAIHSIARWAIANYANTALLASKCEAGLPTIDGAGNSFRDRAYRRWRYLLSLPMIYSTLPNKDTNSDLKAVSWNQLVSIWQVIGRLIRGGSPANVVFCDAAFARRTAFQEDRGDEPQTSLLVSIKQLLSPYFATDSESCITERERELVRALYGPFYSAIKDIGGIDEEV
ncbi:MAG: hypothetical protein F6J93_09235 [Oscillatoria sp. SIO1A7]|nr:hypothetical protein [Oscillatoria sp. SIO1A7]